MADFDRQKFLNNISNILTQRGIKVGEFETSIGGYPGYLSRLKAEENKMPMNSADSWKNTVIRSKHGMFTATMMKMPVP